jgi:hypothetical protein
MRPRVRATGETKMDVTNFQSFAVEFAKIVQIFERVIIDKDVNVDVFVKGNLALANADAKADAFGDNTVSQTMALTSTTVLEDLASKSSSFAQSMSAATPDHDHIIKIW